MDAPFPSFSIIEQKEEEKRRIYQVTAGLKSPDTIRTYRHAFKHFIEITVKNDDLQSLIDTKPSVIESKIISHIEQLKDVKKLKYWSIPTYFSQKQKVMLVHLKKLMEYQSGMIAINSSFSKLIISLRTATENGKGVLDKKVTSHSDVFDAFRLSLIFWHQIFLKEDKYDLTQVPIPPILD